jgi:hypothetical protein
MSFAHELIRDGHCRVTWCAQARAFGDGPAALGASVVAGVSRSLPHGLGSFVDRRFFRHGERQSSIKLADDLDKLFIGCPFGGF